MTLLVVGSAAAVGVQQPTTHLSGTVLATWSGKPQAGVRVTVSGGAEQATDANGHFDFPTVGSGRAKLQVTYAGHAGAARDIVLPVGKPLQVEVLMDSEATDLAPYVTEASRLESRLGLTGFYARRRLGFGRFFSRDDIAKTHDHQVTQVLSIAGASYRCGGAGCAPVLFRYGRECRMTLLIDGYPAPQQDITNMELDDVVGIEVYRRGYQSVAGETLENGYDLAALARGCGLVVIWTRAATPRTD
ncbi:MAG TPA: carboxypeptidase-like regulatory domain-containing protein [Gemmatimonadales bacterium]|nr:carboxypeptidase-like regulatory domain-containing protein [Gemmatimonadales bacterium]